MFNHQFLFIFIFFAVPLLSTASSEFVISDGYEVCIDADVALIEGVMLDRDVYWLMKHPAPVRTAAAYNEDDGGAYTVSIYYYPKFYVTFVRDYIDSVATESPESVWAGGVRVGMHYLEVFELLGASSMKHNKDYDQFRLCLDDVDIYAGLTYQDDKLSRIELVSYRP